jgi:2-amino-4-hydroxy-6-hydroxymethyldihydropteridine diphosphokinase
MNPLFTNSVFVGLGSNLGNREDNIRRALAWMDAHPNIKLVLSSALKETPPWGVEDQPSFINAAALIKTDLSPRALLSALKKAELLLGRAPNGLRWGPRVIDLDILLFGDETLTSEELTIPHPRLTERRFVLEQLVELDKTLRYPGSGRTLLSFLEQKKLTA